MPTRLTKQTVRLSSSGRSAAPDLERYAWRSWQAHVDAGRIGARVNGRPQLSFDARVRMLRQEITLFGRVVTPELERF